MLGAIFNIACRRIPGIPASAHISGHASGTEVMRVEELAVQILLPLPCPTQHSVSVHSSNPRVEAYMHGSKFMAVPLLPAWRQAC